MLEQRGYKSLCGLLVLILRPVQSTLSMTITGRASSSSPNSPVLSAGAKTTRYVRASKSTSPNIGAKQEDQSVTSAGSPVWKHSVSAGANITPPNVVVAAQHTAGAKEKVFTLA